jgi:enamine deaminase RidA (YjgF/YER057c/UK114 family)
VEVADDTSDDERGQIQQVLRQIDQTLCEIGSSRQQMLQIIVHLSSLQSVDELNRQWDQWVPQGHAPVRACVQSGLGGNCLVEMVIEAAVVSGS